MQTTRKSFIPFSLIILVLLVSLACGSSTPTTAPAASNPTEASNVSNPQATNPPQNTEPPKNTEVPKPTQTPKPTAVPPTETQAPEYFLGDAVQKDGYAITAMAVADPATPGMFYQSETGKKLVAVDIIVSNLSGDMFSVNPLYATLLDDGGFVYQTELMGVDDQLSALDLNKGEQVRGWLSYTIPENAKAASLKYSVDFLGDTIIQVPLEAAPEGHTPVTLSTTANIPSSKLGDTVEQSGYSLSAINVEDPASPGFLYTPREGYKLVAVEIVLGNVSGSDALNVNPLYSYLVDSNGFVYSAELGGRDGQIDALDINTGEKAQGWVSFKIPENATPAYLKYQLQFFTGDYMEIGLAE